MYIKCIILFIFLCVIEADFSSYRYRPSATACSFPGLPHGRVRMRQRARVVEFKCQENYELVGNRYATCRNGAWDVPKPICIRPGCDAFPIIENALNMYSHNQAYLTVFCMPGYVMNGSPILYCDGSQWNGTAPTCVNTTVGPKLSCDFESPDLCGWVDDEYHDFNWVRQNRNTPSFFLKTGPTYDHTYGSNQTGYYMYIDSMSRQENDTARLISPIYDASLAKNGCFNFFYHMYGKSTGGLRVFQKPDRMDAAVLFRLPEAALSRYLLFQMWGNQGDAWYSSVAQLIDFSDNFQIIIEGIRGASFTSDIAIDDVAILQGDNCTIARNTALTPFDGTLQTCSGRCNKVLTSISESSSVSERISESSSISGSLCGCGLYCIIDKNCCSDFEELCLFSINAPPDDISPTVASPELPQTQKLIGTTETKTSTSRPTTMSTPMTPPTPTSPVSTTKEPQIGINPTPTQKPVPTTTMKYPTTSTTKTTPKITTKVTSTTTEPLPTYVKAATEPSKPETSPDYEIIAKQKREKEIELEKEDAFVPVPEKVATNSGGWKTVVIVVVSLSGCVAALWFATAWGKTGGPTVLISRLRATVTSDPEVHYLNSHTDDEEI